MPVLIILFFILNSAPSFALSLEEVLSQAEAHSFSIKELKENKKIVDSQIGQLRSQLFPRVDFKASAEYGNKTLENESGVDRWDHQSRISLDYPIFSGGSEWTYFKYKRVLKNKGTATDQRDRLILYQQIINLYFDAIVAQNSFDNLQVQIKTLNKRIREIRNRVQIGRSRRSDLLISLAQKNRLESRHKELELKALQAKRRLFVHLGDREDFDKVMLKYNFGVEAQLPAGWNQRVQGLEVPEIKVSRYEVEASEQILKVAQSEYFPSISLTSNYYIDKSLSQSDDWDVGIQLTIPLLAFGETYYAVSEQRAQLNKEKAQAEHVKRQVNNEWKALKKIHKLKLEQKASLKKALRLSRQNYREHIRDYNSGLVNNIEVTQILDDLIEAEDVYESSRLELARFWYLTKAYVGDF